MEKDELPEYVRNTIDGWFGGIEYELVHFWNQFGTYLVVILSRDEIHNLRLWENPFSPDDFRLSVDDIYRMEQK